MEFDVMTRATTWDQAAALARRAEAAGFSGMLFTEGHQVPWMNIAAAAMAAPALHFSTGIAIAFARSPMVSAEIAWELANQPKRPMWNKNDLFGSRYAAPSTVLR